MNKKFGLLLLMMLVFLALPSQDVQAAYQQDNPCGDTYVVRRGDSLRKIAGMCETTLANLLTWNPSITNPDRIFVGQRINLGKPEVSSPAVLLEPRTGLKGSETQVQVRNFPSFAKVIISIGEQEDDLFALDEIRTDASGSYDLKMEVTGEPGRDWFIQVAMVDDPDVVVASEKFHILEKEGPVIYTVQAGDTLAKIARRFGRTTAHLQVANPDVQNPNRIYPGQELLIPGESDRVHTVLSTRPSEVTRAVANGDRWIEVDLAHQSVHAWEGDDLVRSFVVSTGRPRTPTVTGQYNIWIKLRYDDMRGPGYDLKSVPFVMYFYKGYGLHGTYWHSNFGTPMSAGCVKLSIEDAEWLYNFSEVGTLVDVH